MRHQEYDDDDDDFFQSDDEESMKKSESSEDEENVETVDEIKLRKVKEYLSTITKTDDGEDIDSDEINSRLREEAVSNPVLGKPQHCILNPLYRLKRREECHIGRLTPW